MKILRNIRDSYRPTHNGALRLLVAAAPVASMALALVTGGHIHFPGFHGGHVLDGSHWN